ncbi:hypothetical protein F441_05832 [Phytophthora nicotianae CJ01A1]|uniref:Uncharacterized protein n=6 Tax=Phytophthora nicotianae TaxID=4792 RepID=W2QH13_PHYN3|nr:hypothetical protein PPTG_10415 [Phytophthora nicotianae INRA-310]ETI50698.1 hypothetical protein F443_05828 [Phytophthora nicotianae P1569]ETL43983.1 hypothetical protein L916_05632 [Phytophthora nicotianae]ETO79431.1 hypothetical protein F444_05876 [Phytophthora nicotianae P1976]ETP20472.1 hypothetical protein F441_05832 [Phytophthora nicotianae CJ01A1]ETP48365.1 hypothetical protein F442_05872 [Phytophthora nicotianae P10297]
MADAEQREAATEEDTLGAENEYGLQDLARLPLLEQVHRLFHAIQHKYPYKETNAWKTLPLDQKKKMLNYIRDKRQRKQQSDAESKSEATADDDSKSEDKEPPVDPAMAVKSDPYLKMLQQRSLRSAGPVETGEDGAALPKHPNSAYVAPAQVPHYTQVKPKYKPRWQVAEGEFFEEICVCGVKHDTGKKGKKASLMLHTISSMMSTFGDSTQSCVTAVEEVQALVGDHMKKVLGSVNPEVLTASSCLRTLVEIFEEEAIYYGRWREFRGETKHEQNELEDVEEEELAEELDLFAVSETDDVFNEAFLERIRFADERTKKMDWSIYDVFARGRKLNFMNNKAQQFREWLGLGKISRASLEFLNFVAYHNIGRLVELAIKNRTGGELKQLESPLLKDDIESVALTFLPAPPLPKLIDRPPAAKTRRVGATTASSKSVRVEPHSRIDSEAKASTSTESSTKTEAVGTVKPTIAPSIVSARPTRLKRLR